MTRCIFSLLPNSTSLEVALHLVEDSKGSSVGLSLQDINRMDPTHKSIVEFALQGAFPKDARLYKIEIPSKIAKEFFQKAASQGMLFFEGKKIFFDPFVAWDLEVSVLEDGDSLLVENIFKLGSIQVPLEKVSWFSFDKKGWVLYQGTLRLLNPNYDPKWIKALFSKGEIWPKEEKQFFLNLDEDAPKIRCLFEEDRSFQRKGMLLDLYGMELLIEGALSPQEEAELKEVGYQKKSERLFFCPTDRVAEALELLLLGGWTLTDRKNKKIIPLSKCEVIAKETHSHSLVIEPDLDFQGVKKNWRELAFDGPMLVSLSADSLGLVLPKQLPPFLRDPKFRINPKAPIEVRANCLGELEGVELPKAFQQLLKSSHGEEEILPGPAFCGRLLPYQEKGLRWLSSLKECKLHGLLSDEMGLGKTVQVLSFLSLLGTLPAIIVVPSSLAGQWKREIEKFLPHIATFQYEGDPNCFLDRQQEFICIVSFGMMRKEKDFLSSKIWSTVALDEAHAILNQKTLLFDALSSLKAGFRLAITGTPLINRRQDLESLFSFLVPNLLEKGLEPDKIKKRTSPLILRRTQEEVFDELPEKIEEEVYVELTERQKEKYKQIQEGIRSSLQKQKPMEVLEIILRLRQLCLHPALLDTVPEEKMDLEESSKFSLLLLELEELIAENKKVIVCSSFAKALRLLYKALPFGQNQLFILDGETKHRLEIVDSFEKSTEGCILLLSLKAGGVGLNLPSTDAFFLLDPWWNEAMEQQAIYRALRLGRKKKLIVKKYIAPQTLEEKMLLLKKSKKFEEALLLGEKMILSEDLTKELFDTYSSFS